MFITFNFYFPHNTRRTIQTNSLPLYNKNHLCYSFNNTFSISIQDLTQKHHQYHSYSHQQSSRQSRLVLGFFQNLYYPAANYYPVLKPLEHFRFSLEQQFTSSYQNLYSFARPDKIKQHSLGGWNNNNIFLTALRLEKYQGAAGLISPGASLLGLLTVASLLYPHMIFSWCAHISVVFFFLIRTPVIVD